MNRAILLFTLLSVGIIVTCNGPGPTIPPYRNSLSGSYQGTYAFIYDPGGGPDTVMQAVRFTFTELAFTMYADTEAVGYDPSVCFCKAFGSYAVTDRVNLLDPGGPPLPDNCEVCEVDRLPFGIYTLEQPSGGLKLTCIDTTGPEAITRQLVLIRLGDT